jgi:hypothetical protein
MCLRGRAFRGHTPKHFRLPRPAGLHGRRGAVDCRLSFRLLSVIEGGWFRPPLGLAAESAYRSAPGWAPFSATVSDARETP